MSSEAVCPSSPLETATHLLGVVRADGRVAFVSTPLPITDSFAEIAAEGRTPEKRFRFAGPCLEGGCAQWTGTRCSVADDVAEAVAEAGAVDPAGRLRPCAIRRSCRWFSQRGAEACRACPVVVTDTTDEPVAV